MNNELERIWKEVVVAEYKVLSRTLPEGTEAPGQDLNPGPTDYEAGVLSIRMRLSVRLLLVCFCATV
jgi:hypothetical protein